MMSSKQVQSPFPQKLHGKQSIARDFQQQKIKAWQPVITFNQIFCVSALLATFFGIMGIALLAVALNATECQMVYDNPTSVCDDVAKCTTSLTVSIDAQHCRGPLLSKGIKPPIFLYYSLTRYYQNHRRYVNSRNEKQLRGELITSVDDLSSCSPIIVGEDDRILSPCGLIAWSVFNDSFTMETSDGTTIPLDESAEAIAWRQDILTYKNPTNVDSTKVHEWLNEEIFPGRVENGHFIVWMRLAALPSFRKLYGRIDEEITLPVTIKVASRYPSGPHSGKKLVILSTATWIGGRNIGMGIGYLALSMWCIGFAAYISYRNRHHPRILGDVRHLSWLINRHAKPHSH